MKALRVILIIVGVIVAIAVVLCLIGPKDYQVERSTIINASPDVIFPHVSHLEKRDAWYPWSKIDPNMARETTGTDGTVGAISRWESDDKDVGKGEEEILAIKVNERVDTKLRFDGQGESDAYITLAAADGGTKVAWGFSGKNPFFARMFMLFMDLEGIVGGQFEQGLTDLKTLCEAEANKTYRGYKVQHVDFPATTYATVRETVNAPDVQAFYTKNFTALGQNVGAELDGHPSGLFYEWNEEEQRADMAAAMPTKKKVDAEGVTYVEIPAGKALLIDYYGAYDKSGEAHYALEDYLKEKGLNVKIPVIEVYANDPTTVPEDQILTKIYYLLAN